MAYSDRDYTRSFIGHSYFPPAVKWLMIVNTALFLVYFFLIRLGYGWLFAPFGLVPVQVLERFALWQPATYMFLHDPGGVGHILMNMLGLFFFGPQLEMTWGSRRFLKYYFACGIGAALCVVLANYLIGDPLSRTIGASGAIYGVLLAFGVMFPDEVILVMGIVPIKAKYFVMLMGAIAFLSTFGVDATNVSHFAHLGGMAWGYGYIRLAGRDLRWRGRSRASESPLAALKRAYRTWQLERAKKKFQAYVGRDRDSAGPGRGPDRWRH
jgi:membrane associated rhomboid family serine protease